MSYDLTFFHASPGVDPELTYHDLMEQEERNAAELNQWRKRPLPEMVRARMQRIADALKSQYPTFVQFQPKSVLPWIELNEETLQVQISIHEYAVHIMMPYFRQRASDMMNLATGCCKILGAAEGYVAYDPQLGRTIDAANFDAMVARYRGVDSVLPEILGIAAKKPWWKFW